MNKVVSVRPFVIEVTCDICGADLSNVTPVSIYNGTVSFCNTQERDKWLAKRK